MVNEMPFDGPRNVAYEVFEEVAEEYTEDLYAEIDRHTVDLKERTGEGGLLSSGSSEAKLIGHPDAASFQIETPAYCISVWDEDYREVGREAAERIEEEFGINVYLFERE